MVIPIAAIGQVILASVPTDDLPGYFSMMKELGSFGLVAFLVWYFVKYALPQQRTDYLNANNQQRQDHINAQSKQEEREIAAKVAQRQQYIDSMERQRVDFLTALERMQKQSDKLATAVESLAQATYSHVAQAKRVWEAQGFDADEAAKQPHERR